jgi:hypothetical protein
MNIQLDRRMGKSEFLTWVQAYEGRYELAGSRAVRVRMRGAGGFSGKPKVIEGRDAVIEIVSLGIGLPLAEIYAGMPVAQAGARGHAGRGERFKRANGGTRRR